MILFFICLMPLFYWSVQGLFDNEGVRIRDILLPFAKGFFFAVPAILFYWAMDVYFKLTWSPLKIYFYAFFNKEGFLYLPVILLLLGLYWKKDEGLLYFRELVGIFCGYYFLIAVIDALTGRAYTTYDMLLLPIFRVITLISASILINRFISSSGRKKYYILISIFVLPLFLNLFPLLHLLNRHILLYIFLIPVSIGVFVLGYLDLQEKLSW